MFKELIRIFTGKKPEPVVKEKEKKIKPKPEKYFELYSLDKEKEDIQRYSEFLKDSGDNFEQKRAVVSDCKRILVLAGAGSGKTKVLTKRFIHLVKNKGVDENKILALTFTKSAANEMIDRISKTLGIKKENIKRQVRTIHSFAFSILKQNEQFVMVDEKKQREIFEQIIYDFKDNDEIINSMYSYIVDNLVPKVKEHDSKNTKQPQVKNKPTGFGEKKIKTNLEKIFVRSKSERDIANFLNSLGIEFEYEKPTDWSDGRFLPDFTIGDDIFIEHWCYNDKSKEFPQINKKKYLKHRKWKENQYKKHKKILVSIEEIEMTDLKQLKIRLKKELEKILKRKLQEIEMLDLLELSPHYKRAYVRFKNELIEVVNLAKSRHLDVEDVKEMVKDEEKEKIINFYNVLIPVMQEYKNRLKKMQSGGKDFNDLIRQSFELLKNDRPTLKRYQSKIKHLLIDEFQDVSFGEVKLFKLLINKDNKDANLFVVGDDWQSIYGWRGSDVNCILNFEQDFGSCEKIILPINYRSAGNIVEASTYFIQLNKNQEKKDIRCSKENENLNYPQIIQLNASDDYSAARRIIGLINEEKKQNRISKDEEILILKRSKRISKLYEDEFAKYPEFKIKPQTIHHSKGTEFEYVFILGLKGGIFGFPNVYADKDIKRVIYENPIEDKEEEERRLFYVAMTRAKKKLFLISEQNNESEFVKAIPDDYKLILPNQKNAKFKNTS